MPFFVKKPVTIEARQVSNAPDNNEALLDWIESFGGSAWVVVAPSGEDAEIAIQTLEGVLRAGRGDWIIKGVKNEFYPCKADIFEETYSVSRDRTVGL